MSRVLQCQVIGTTILVHNLNYYINTSNIKYNKNKTLITDVTEEISDTVSKSKKIKNASLMLNGMSYMPEIIYNTDDPQKDIEKVKIVDGLCINYENVNEYLNKLYSERHDIDYNGMSGGEIIPN